MLALASGQPQAAAAAPTSGAGDNRAAEAETAESQFRFPLFALELDADPNDDSGAVEAQRSVAPPRIDGDRRRPAKLWLQAGENPETFESRLLSSCRSSV